MALAAMAGLAGSLSAADLACADQPRFLSPMTELAGSKVGAKVVGGTPTTGYPAVGALLLRRDSTGPYRFSCTGTLIGCSTFLTAAHCVCDGLTGTDCQKIPDNNLYVYFQHLGLVRVKAIPDPPTGYMSPDLGSATKEDVALMTLATPVRHVRPRLINSLAAPPAGGDEVGTIVGFGLSGDNANDVGIKRYGGLTTTRCRGFPPGHHICWNYQSGRGSVNSCNGDSGGPLFQWVRGKEDLVTGVTSGGNPSCGDGDHAFDSNVYTNLKWIRDNSSEPNDDAICGGTNTGLTGGGEANARRYSGMTGEFDSDTREFRYGFSVAGAKLLRVTLNGVEPYDRDRKVYTTDFDLYLVPGKDQQDVGKAECRRDGPGNFAVCEVDPKSRQDWTVVVRAKKGNGMVQVTATLF